MRASLRRAPLNIVFTDPQISIIGGGLPSRARNTARNRRSVLRGSGARPDHTRNQGVLHVYAETGTGLFLGAEMLGPEAEHIGHLLAWALQMKLTIAQMLEMPLLSPGRGRRAAHRAARRASEAHARAGSRARSRRRQPRCQPRVFADVIHSAGRREVPRRPLLVGPADAHERCFGERRADESCMAIGSPSPAKPTAAKVRTYRGS